MDLAKSEGWNQTEKDWNLILENKTNRYFVAEDKGKVIGTIIAMNYANIEAWIGMLLIDKDYRRQGIGRMMMVNIIESLKGFVSVRLDATPAGRPVYQKLGFVDEFRLHRMVCQSFKGIEGDISTAVDPVMPEDMDDIIQFDSDIFGVKRTYLLNNVRSNYPHKAFLLRKFGKVAGYVLGRNGVRFNYIGPVFASSTGDAILLLSRALRTIEPNSAVAINIMDNRNELREWLEKNGFEVQRYFTRMYLEKNPFPGKPENQYLIIGPEFG
jgi:ribosomal protein S18 acetylase RimI-like enzyme